jgi:AraC-like DNA-binding protein
MVCNRCIMAVEDILKRNGLEAIHISLGEVVLSTEEVDSSIYQILSKDFMAIGFELIEDKKTVLVEKVKAAIIALVHEKDANLKTNLSGYLNEKLHEDYTVLASSFSTLTGNTIEKYFIQQKLERAKELISYGELTLSEIAFQLNYSSVAHLSAQFKKELGITPTAFKNKSDRKTLDKI